MNSLNGTELNWSELGEAFDRLAGQSAAERNIQLGEIRLRDARLADELSSLLLAHDSADGFFEERVPRIFGSMAPNLDLTAGERLLHFEIVEPLGEGSLAKVYLARDTELGRLVALKVSLSQSQEARTLAHFCIDGIVQVYSEHLVDRGGVLLRLMCLQVINGPTLAQLMHQLRASRESSLVQVLEKFSKRKVAFEPSALKWRELLSSLSLPEAIVLLGIRLGEILDHAHDLGVLHLDIKPANILIDPYGRPYLSDFNVSTYQERLTKGDLKGMGGTPHYMAPEQTRFFESGTVASAGHLDVRCDVYALAVVLRDLLQAADYRNSDIEGILARATEADQNQRTASAAALAQDLGAWLRGNLAQKEMPRLWRGFRWIDSYPLAALISLTVLSQLAASVINISYNRLQLVSALSVEQYQIFINCALIYNLITYPLTIFCGAYALRPLFQPSADRNWARQCTLRIPLIMFLAISFGWLPGAWIFPRVIEYFAGPLPPEIYWHFAGSFSLAWLISMTTSLAVSVVVLARSLYPKYWQGQSALAARELRNCERLNGSLTLASALVPLVSVVMVIWLAPAEYSLPDYRSFRIFLLVTAGFGLLNLLFVQRLTRIVETAIAALKRPQSFD